MKNYFKVTDVGCKASVGLLILRLVAGSAFILHGWPKMQAPMAWMGPDAPVPGVFQFLAAFSEFGGGIAWILGLLVPLASLGMASTMAVAVYTHAIVKGDPFVGHEGSYELAAIYFCISVLLITVGAGKYSLDNKFFGQK